MISIVCVDIQDEGNLGAIARLMLNFGLTELILVNTGHAPGKKTINPLSPSALDRASHAKSLLANIRVSHSLADTLNSFDYAIATTALVGDDYNLKRTPLTPQEVARQIADVAQKKRVALVIGREDHGLSNEELVLCDITVTIPASKQYSVLNVSHACAILLYELFSARSASKSLVETHIKPKAMAGKTELTNIQKLVCEVLNTTKFPAGHKKETQKLLWHRIFAKSFLTRREAFGVMGFLKRVLGRR